MKRKFIVSKLGIDIPVLAIEQFLVLDLPQFIKPLARLLTDFLLDKIDGKVIFDKKIYKKTIYEVSRYIHFQSLVLLQVLIGVFFYKIRKIFKIRLFFKISTDNVIESVVRHKYFYFPGLISCLVYEGHLPISFMAFQIDKMTLATSFRDKKFADKVFDKLKLSGYTTLAWTSNYFLGYAQKIQIDTDIKTFSTKDLLISTAASIPGYNRGINVKSFYNEALERKYSEESFPSNPNAINFSGIEDSEIAKPVAVQRVGERYVFKILNMKDSLSYIGKEGTVNILYPVALLTEENQNSPDWKAVPQKNVSGFILGYRNNLPLCVSLGSTSFVRLKVNELMAFIKNLCSDEGIDFFAYIHTDDGGAVGDFYKTPTGVQRFSPVVGHCFSSMVGFVPFEKEKGANEVLANWDN